MATPGYRSNNSMPASRNMQQQKHVDMSRTEANRRIANNRQGIDGGKYLRPVGTPAGQIPGGPNKLQQIQATYHAASQHMDRLHGAAQPRQFGGVVSRLKGMLRRGR